MTYAESLEELAKNIEELCKALNEFVYLKGEKSHE